MAISIEANDHVAIRVKDLQKSADWYRDFLGFDILQQWDNAWLLQVREIRLGIYVSAAAKTLENPDDFLVLHHFAFRVTPQAMLDAEVFLQERGIAYEGPKDPGFFWSLVVTDPDGYRVELISFHERRDD